MRYAFLTVMSAAAILAACSEQQQPTSPVDARRGPSASAAMSTSPSTEGGIKLPDAKPQPQIGFTKVATYPSATVPVAPGASVAAIATCPAGSVLVGGGFSMPLDEPVPRVVRSHPDGYPNASGWRVLVSNRDAGAVASEVTAWVTCAS